MEGTKIAIPCTGEAGLQARVSAHFGRCDSYAIVTIEEGRIKAIESIRNGKNSRCIESVRTLVQSAVSLALVGTMGVGGCQKTWDRG
jgi:predicted Fe-Mo cluster-binding NifX family protein